MRIVRSFDVVVYIWSLLSGICVPRSATRFLVPIGSADHSPNYGTVSRKHEPKPSEIVHLPCGRCDLALWCLSGFRLII
jgi:hypothetical protein